VIVFREAQAKDDEQLTRLMARPLPGELSLSLCRDPSFLQSCSACGPPRRVLVAEEDEDRVVAVCSSFKWPYRLAGRTREIWTFGDLRSDPSMTGKGLTGLGWAAVRESMQGLPAVVSMVNDNPISRRLFARPRVGWPVPHQMAHLKTHVFPLWGVREKTDIFSVQPSLAQILRFLERDASLRDFVPEIDSESARRVLPPLENFVGIHDGNQLLACGALWDRSSYRQTLVAAYHGRYALLAHLLPKPGTPVPLAFATFVSGTDKGAIQQVLSCLRTRAKSEGAAFLVWGCDAATAVGLPRSWPRLTYLSQLFQLCWDGDEKLPPCVASTCAYEVAWL
jgi:hypothetical protein